MSRKSNAPAKEAPESVSEIFRGILESCVKATGGGRSLADYGEKKLGVRLDFSHVYKMIRGKRPVGPETQDRLIIVADALISDPDISDEAKREITDQFARLIPVLDRFMRR